MRHRVHDRGQVLPYLRAAPSVRAIASAEAALMSGLWVRNVARVGTGFRSSARLIATAWQEISFPDWLHYLHFHEIKRWIGLPTAPLIAFMIGLGCVAGSDRRQPLLPRGKSGGVPGHPDVADRMAAGRDRIVCSRNFAEETVRLRVAPASRRPVLPRLLNRNRRVRRRTAAYPYDSLPVPAARRC